MQRTWIKYSPERLVNTYGQQHNAILNGWPIIMEVLPATTMWPLASHLLDGG